MSKPALKFLLATLFALFLAPAAHADVFEVGAFAMTSGEAPGTYQFTAQVPSRAVDQRGINWPAGCIETSATRQNIGSMAQLSYALTCSRRLTRADVIQTPWKVDGATYVSNVMGAQVKRSLTPGEAGIIIPVGETAGTTRTLATIAAEFTAQGVLHIWMGWDHLAFVFCLCLLARGRELIGLVTAFTAGHSVSLGLAFFEVIRMPVPPVEAAIAVSIAFMAREALIAGKNGELPPDLRRHLIVVVLFGLLHGLGFATALSELGVGKAERLPGLLFFNVGVEIGQLVFVAAVAATMAALRGFAVATPVRVVSLYGVGALGCFWMVERVAGFAIA